MGLEYRFQQLPETQQKRAKAMFFNAANGDDYLYQLGTDGNVLSRQKWPENPICTICNDDGCEMCIEPTCGSMGDW